MTIQYVNSIWEQGHRGCDKGVIFTDSAYAIGCLLKGWNSTAYPLLVDTIRSLLKDSPISWQLVWIPAHAGVDDNERADAIARRAATGSKAGRTLDVEANISQRTFLIYDYF